jgi:hypothetical protein
VALLNAEEGSGIERTAAKSKSVKGDRRMVVTCDEIEGIFFDRQPDPSKTFGRRKNRASRAIQEDGEWKSVDMVDKDDSLQGTRQSFDASDSRLRPIVRPSQIESAVNGSIGGEKGLQERREETVEEHDKRLDGQQRAEEREMVRRAARRGIVFGFEVLRDHENSSDSRSRATTEGNHRCDLKVRRKCEAVMNGSVVEPSFAKGNWSIRWRERNE